MAVLAVFSSLTIKITLNMIFVYGLPPVIYSKCKTGKVEGVRGLPLDRQHMRQAIQGNIQGKLEYINNDYITHILH